LGGTLFDPTHLHVLRHIVTAHPTCVFSSLIDDTHTVGHTLGVVLVFLQLEQEFSALRLSMQPLKCVVWSSQGLNHFISLLYSWFGFLYFGDINGIQIICWIICDWRSSWKSWDDMFIDPQVVFVMFSLCYA
jgi:hypothetical protein